MSKSSLPSQKPKQLCQCKKPPITKEIVSDSIENRGNSNTITVPTNQNTGRENGNCCGNSITIMLNQADEIKSLQQQLSQVTQQLGEILALLRDGAGAGASAGAFISVAPQQKQKKGQKAASITAKNIEE